MGARQSKSQPSWTDVKAKLASFDQKGLLGLIQDLYAANKENQTFLHARFGVGDDALQPYKQTIERWVSPDVLKKQQDISVRRPSKPFLITKRQLAIPPDWPS
jgi:hypothetical protein